MFELIFSIQPKQIQTKYDTKYIFYFTSRYFIIDSPFLDRQKSPNLALRSRPCTVESKAVHGCHACTDGDMQVAGLG